MTNTNTNDSPLTDKFMDLFERQMVLDAAMHKYNTVFTLDGMPGNMCIEWAHKMWRKKTGGLDHDRYQSKEYQYMKQDAIKFMRLVVLLVLEHNGEL